MNNRIYVLFCSIIILSTLGAFSVFAIDMNTPVAASGSLDAYSIDFNNTDLVFITIEDTNSMLPTLDENNIVLALPISSDTNLSIGDIVVYNKYSYNDSGFIIHRIIDIEDGMYLLKGDNNHFNDGFIPLEDIKYKAVGVVY